MADLTEMMMTHYNQNIADYIRKHPGHFLILEFSDGRIKKSFYRTLRQFDRAMRKYEGLKSPSYFTARIPKSI